MKIAFDINSVQEYCAHSAKKTALCGMVQKIYFNKVLRFMILRMTICTELIHFLLIEYGKLQCNFAGNDYHY